NIFGINYSSITLTIMFNKKLVIIAILLFGIFAPYAAYSQQSSWQPADSPLMTKWASDLAPDNVHQEYPRPQMKRKKWINLNGRWDYAIVPAFDGPPKNWDGDILVPFPVE